MLAGYQLTCGHCQTKTVLTHQIVAEIETAGVYTCECEAKLFPTDRGDIEGLYHAAKETTSAEKDNERSKLYVVFLVGIPALVIIFSIKAYGLMLMLSFLMSWGIIHNHEHTEIIDIDFTVGSVPESQTEHCV